MSRSAARVMPHTPVGSPVARFCYVCRMPSRSEELITHLDQNRAALRAAVDSIPPAHREARPGPNRWSVAEVLEHLAIVERRLAGRLSDALTAAKTSAAARSSHPSAPAIDPDQLRRLGDRSQRFKTSEVSEPKGGMTADQAWAALEQVRADVVNLVRASDPFPLPEPIAPHPRFGPWNFQQWVVFAGGHDARHADQIRAMQPAFCAPAVSPSVLRTIGRTPITRLRSVVPAGSADVVVKLEFFNPTGSYKDRMALAMIEGAERR